MLWHSTSIRSVSVLAWTLKNEFFFWLGTQRKFGWFPFGFPWTATNRGSPKQRHTLDRPGNPTLETQVGSIIPGFCGNLMSESLSFPHPTTPTSWHGQAFGCGSFPLLFFPFFRNPCLVGFYRESKRTHRVFCNPFVAQGERLRKNQRIRLVTRGATRF